MEWQKNQDGENSMKDHSIFGEPPRKFSLAEAAEKSDDELYRTAVEECARIAEAAPQLLGTPEIILEVDRRTGVGIGIAALAAANLGTAA